MAEFTLTVYGDDDITPLFTVGTAADHANPYLHVPEKYRESSVDLLRGGAVIGQYNLRIIDPQTGATKAVRWLTEKLGSPTGHSATMRRRALFKRVDPDTRVIQDGVVGRLALSESFAGFHLDTRDIRERARKVKVFTAGGTTTVAPRGVVNGYGELASGDSLVPATEPFTAQATLHGTRHGVQFDLDANWELVSVYPNRVVSEGLREAIEPEIDRGYLTYSNVEVWWRISDLYEWERLADSTYYQSAANTYPIVTTREAPVIGLPRYGLAEVIETIGYMDPTGSATLPLNGAIVEVMIVHVGPPTAKNPWHFEGTWGTFVRNLLRGDYSDQDPRLRYDEAAILAIDTPIRVRITEPRDDLREVLEELCKMIGAAPALNAAGEISPILYELPSSVSGLTVLDDSNCRPIPGWEHTGDDTVTVVEVTYGRDVVVSAFVDPGGEEGASDLLTTRPVTIRRQAPQAVLDIMGEEVLEIDAWAFRSLGGSRGEAASGSVADESGAELAEGAKDRALDRFVFGGSSSTCEVMASEGLTVGQWILDQRPWRPNYSTGERGGSTLAQVVGIRELNEAWVVAQLSDAAPEDNPLAAPTLGTVTVSSDNDLTIPITTVPAGYVQGQYAVNATEPAATSPLWKWAGGQEYYGAGDEIIVPLLPPDSTVWVRARAHAPGRIPSAWTAAVSVTTNAGPVVERPYIDVNDSTGSVDIGWRATVGTAGVRIQYVTHAIGTDPPAYTDTVDVDATEDRYELPSGTVAPGYTITASLTPYTGYASGAVSGTAGDAVVISASREDTTQPPVLDLVETQNLVGGQINLTSATVEVMATLGAGGRAPVDYRYRVSDPNGIVTAFGAWTEIIAAGGTTGTVEITVSRGNYARHITVQARDEDGRTSSANITIDRHPFQSTDLSASVTFNATNEALVQVNAPADTANIYITAAADTDPADPTSSAYDATIAGPAGQVNTGIVVAEGSVAHVKVRVGADGGVATFLAKNTEGGSITASIAFNALNEAVVTANGPSGTTALYITAAADTEPADPTTTTYDATIPDQSGTANTGVVVAEGSIAFVRIAPYDGTTLGSVVAFSASNAAAKAAPVAYIRVQSQSATATTLEYDGSDGTEGRSVAAQYQRRIDKQNEDGTDIEGTWSAWSATLPATEAVARDIYPQTVHLRVRDADGRQSSVARIEVPGNAALLNLQNFRETELGDTVLWEWTPGSLVSEVWVYYETRQKPVIGDPWPTNQAGREPDEFLPVGTTSFRFTKPAEGHKAFLQFEPRDEDWRAGDVLRASVHGIPDVKPQIAYIGQATATTPAPNKTNVVASITDSLNRSGRLTAWLNRAGYTEPDPDTASDGYIDLTLSGGSITVTDADAWVLTSGGTANLFRDLTIDAERGKRIFLQWVSDDGEDTGVQDKLLHSWSRILDQASGGLAPDVVTTAAIANAAVEAGKIADGAATAAKIATNAITATKITDGAIETPKLAAGAVTTAKITAGAITAGTIAAGAVEAAKIAAGAVTTAKLDALAVSADKIAANAVTAAKINVAELSEISAGVGIVTSGVLRNSGNTRGIRLDAADTLPAGWTTYLDLGATLSAPILKHPKLSLNADGSATFSGVVTIDSGTNYAAGYDPSTKETPAGAQAKADAAESDAKTYASGLVSPLSAIIRSTTQPTAREDASALQSGDVWIETDNGDKPYVWNGTSFVEQYTKIDGGYITTGAIVSSTYVAGSAGWKIDTAGGAEFNDVTVRGALDGATGTFNGTVASTSGSQSVEVSGGEVRFKLSGVTKSRLWNSAGTATKSGDTLHLSGEDYIALSAGFSIYTHSKVELLGTVVIDSIPTITGTLSGTRSFTDADGNLNAVTISNGLITDWAQDPAP